MGSAQVRLVGLAPSKPGRLATPSRLASHIGLSVRRSLMRAPSPDLWHARTGCAILSLRCSRSRSATALYAGAKFGPTPSSQSFGGMNTALSYTRIGGQCRALICRRVDKQ